MGGDLISVRYWLGRLLRHNYFRESNGAVRDALRKYLSDNGCEKGSRLVSDLQSWSPIADVLRHDVEVIEGRTPTKNLRLVAALKALLANPDLTNAELATIAETTEKQIAKMTDVFVLRKVWKSKTS